MPSLIQLLSPAAPPERGMDLRPEALEADVRWHEREGDVDREGRLLWAMSCLARGDRVGAGRALRPALGPEAPARFGVLEQCLQARPEPSRLAELARELASSPDAEVGVLWMLLGGVQRGAGLNPGPAFERAAACFLAEDDLVGWASAVRERSLDLVAAGETSLAQRLLLRASSRLQAEDELQVLLQLDLARLEALRGDWAEAERRLDAGHRAMAGRPADEALWPHLLSSRAAVRMELGDVGASTLEMLERAYGLLQAREGAESGESLEVMMLLGELHRLRGEPRRALPLLARVALALEGADRQAEGQARWRWAEALEASGQAEAAQSERERAERLLQSAEALG